jgi:selenide,water dikinase
VATALKAGQVPDTVLAAATRSMTSLNREASEAALRHGVSGGTDVTGFGLLGHAEALARESGLTLDIDVDLVPLLPGAPELASAHQAGGLRANRLAFEGFVEYRGDLDEVHRDLLYDPQTSGGLLLLVPEAASEVLLRDVEGARMIGRAVPMTQKPLIVRS